MFAFQLSFCPPQINAVTLRTCSAQHQFCSLLCSIFTLDSFTAQSAMQYEMQLLVHHCLVVTRSFFRRDAEGKAMQMQETMGCRCCG